MEARFRGSGFELINSGITLFIFCFLAQDSQTLFPSDSQTRISKTRIPNLESRKPESRNPTLKLPTVLPSTIHHYILPDDA